MLPFTLDNHFSYGYGSGVFNPADKSELNPFWCKYSRCAREPKSFREECAETARLISIEAEARGRIPYVLLSGGLDSEVVVKGFLEARVPFKTITFRFKHGRNLHEMRYVEAFVRAHRLDHSYFDIDALHWIKTDEAARMFAESHSHSVGTLPHMKLMSHVWFELHGMPVLGNGDVYLERGDGSWNYVETEYTMAWYRHAVRHQILGGIGFLQHTPELVLSLLRNPRLQRLGAGLDPRADAFRTSRYVKYAAYRDEFPDLLLRPKFGGQELVYREFQQRTKELRTKDYDAKHAVPFQKLTAMLEPQ